MVVNKVVEESVQEGYVQRLSKGQATGVEQLEQVRATLTDFLSSSTRRPAPSRLVLAAVGCLFAPVTPPHVGCI